MNSLRLCFIIRLFMKACILLKYYITFGFGKNVSVQMKNTFKFLNLCITPNPSFFINLYIILILEILVTQNLSKLSRLAKVLRIFAKELPKTGISIHKTRQMVWNKFHIWFLSFNIQVLTWIKKNGVRQNDNGNKYLLILAHIYYYRTLFSR